VFSSGYSFCLGGNKGGGAPVFRGGARGGILGVARGGGAGAGEDVPEPVPALLIGGAGRFAVLRPVVSARYGPGGGFGASSISSCCVWRLGGAGTAAPSPPPVEDDGLAIARLGEDAPGP